MQPHVTIAIPAYKSARLSACIRSALSQTYQDIEVIVVDDHSLEPIAEVVHSFSDPRVRYFRNPHNLGQSDPSRNWNQCLHHARGEWFCLLCDDDQYAPSFVETLLALSERYPQSHVLRSGVRITDAQGNETGCYPLSPEWESLEDYMRDYYSGRRRQTVSEFMLRRRTMLECGGYVALPYAWGSDNLSIYRFCQQGGIASTTEPLTTFCDSGQNLSSNQLVMDEKLSAFRQYIEETKRIVRTHNFRTDLLPVIAEYYRQATMSHMMEADRQALRHIIEKRRELDVSVRSIVRVLLQRLLSH